MRRRANLSTSALKASVKQVEHNFHCGPTNIDLAKTYTHLGVLFHEHNNPTVGAQALGQSASKALSVLLCKTRHFWGLGSATYSELFHTGIARILDYGDGVWGYKAACIDNVQHRAILVFLGVGKYTPNLALDYLIGWISLGNRRQTHMVRLWNRIQSMENDCFPKIVMDWYRKLALEGGKNGFGI